MFKYKLKNIGNRQNTGKNQATIQALILIAVKKL